MHATVQTMIRRGLESPYPRNKVGRFIFDWHRRIDLIELSLSLWDMKRNAIRTEGSRFLNEKRTLWTGITLRLFYVYWAHSSDGARRSR